jgi:hypothetical protein
LELAPDRWLDEYPGVSMPSKSRAQHNLMEMVAHDPAAAKRVGIKQSVGKDFVQADKGRSMKSLPQHKAMGGLVPSSSYPPKFNW